MTSQWWASRSKPPSVVAPIDNKPTPCLPAIRGPVGDAIAATAISKLLDRLGYEEAWIGEHHSAGHEIIPDPMIFIAYAAPQTRHVKLGTGVLSLPYHNPLLVADRALFLDQLLRGRFMLGLGPGALPGDAAMLGISIEDQRGALEQDTDVLMHLLRSDDPISIETPRYKLVNAKSQYGPYTDSQGLVGRPKSGPDLLADGRVP